MKLIKKDKKDSSFGRYPCNVYLHNALRFIEHGKYSAAYSEICYALQKASDVLSEHEKELWNRESK